MDRNTKRLTPISTILMSLSARRAWIEMDSLTDDVSTGGVALRKESVDRNLQNCCPYLSSLTSLSARRAWIEISRIIISVLGLESLSARRAWIEIPAGCWRDARRALSLSARRAWIEINDPISAGTSHGGRSPQGERG